MNFFIKKIIANLSKPNLIPVKILNKLQNIYLRNFYAREKYENEQDKIFLKLGLSRIEGSIKLNRLKSQYSFLEKPMSSEHQNLFASISIKKNIKDILEIGTFDGVNAFLLSQLFEYSQVDTIDLDETNEGFRKTYGREEAEKLKIFCEERDGILSLSKNIIFKKKNSLQLTFSDKKYDLIWIDGAHGYPFVPIDIANSLRLLKPNGIIVCDDVWQKKPMIQDQIYNSFAAFETLSTLKKADIINFELIYKRLDKINNCNKRFRTFLAYVQIK